MGIDEFDAMQDSRKAAIRAAANLLESVDRARQARKRITALFPQPGGHRGSPEDKKPRGDFLFDLLRLNARYLNQLSALGTAHSRIAHQALERLYSAMVPMGRGQGGGYPVAPSGEEIRFAPGTLSRKFHVDHCVDPNIDTVTVRWCPLSPTVRVRGDWLLEINGHSAVGRDHMDFPIHFQKPNVFTVTVTDQWPIRRRYTSELLVDVGPQRRCIPVVLDFRETADGDAP